MKSNRRHPDSSAQVLQKPGESKLFSADQSPSLPTGTTPQTPQQPGYPSLPEDPHMPLPEYQFEEGGAISELDLHMSEGFLTIVRIPLMSELRQELEALIQRRGWEWQEGLVNVLASGISQLSAQDREAAPAAEETAHNARSAGQAQLDPVTQELAYYHAMYSAMKFRAFSLLEKLKVLEMRESALKGKLDLNTRWADATRQQIEALQAENAQLRQSLAEPGESAATPVPRSAPKPNGKDREGGLLGKLQGFVARQNAGEQS